MKKITVLFLALFLTQFSFAQSAEDIPEEGPSVSDSTESGSEDASSDEEFAPPPETQKKSRSSLKNKRGTYARFNPKSLTRIGIKIEGSFSVLEVPKSSGVGVSGIENGAGYGGLLSLGWDMSHQPVFLELESGYRAYTFGADTLHIIPVRFGTFYRDRIGAKSLWKPGFGPSLDFRIVKDTGKYYWSAIPSLFVSQTFEFSSVILEFVANIHRFGPNDNFFNFATRLGLRF